MRPSQWVNTEPDAGALHALLLRLAQRIPPDSIDQLWIFPTRRIAIGESTVVVASAFQPDDADRRRVITARFAVTRDRKGVATVQERFDEHGTAPHASVTRVVQGVLRRLGEEGEQPPREQAVDGDEERWWALVLELGGTRPEAAAVSAPTAHADAEAVVTAEGQNPSDGSADPLPGNDAPDCPATSGTPDTAGSPAPPEPGAPA